MSVSLLHRYCSKQNNLSLEAVHTKKQCQDHSKMVYNCRDAGFTLIHLTNRVLISQVNTWTDRIRKEGVGRVAGDLFIILGEHRKFRGC